jgi:outer membrane protein
LTSCNQEKTGYVNSETLVKDYKVMIAYQDSLKEQENAFKAKYDKQLQELQKEYNEFQANSRKMSRAKLAKRNQEINQKYQQIQQLQQAESYQLQQQSQKRLTEIIEEVTRFVKEYGKKNGYTYIFGTSDVSPAILYGKEDKDLTDVILNALNAGDKTATDTKTEKKESDNKESTK